MRRVLLIVATLIALPVSALALTGDCDDDGVVELPELVRGVVIALGTRPLQDCEPFDENGDGVIDVAELIAGVSLSMTSQPTATATPSETGTVPGTPTDTPTVGATPTSTTSPSDTPTGTLSPTPSATVTPTVDVNASPTSTATVTPTAEASVTSTASATSTRTATRTASGTVTLTLSPTRTRTPTATATQNATNTPTSSSTPTATVTPTVPQFFVFNFGAAGTSGIPCITTPINFQLLAGADTVRDLRFDFCLDADKFDVSNINCQVQSASAIIEPAEIQLSCDLQSDDPHGQVRVTAHGIGGGALADEEVLFTCNVPVLPGTLTGVYTVDYAIRGTTTGNESFVDSGGSTITISADNQSQGQCCGDDSQCSSGFCRGGVPDLDSACCESECVGGVCNDAFAAGTCLAQPGGEFRVNTVSYRSQFQPSVAVMDDGFVVAWHGNALDLGTNSTDIFARRYDRFGAPVMEITVNQTLAGAQMSAAVAALGSNFVVAWVDSYGVYGRRFNSLGMGLGSEFQVSTSTSFQYYPGVGGAPDGSFVVVWDTYGPDGFGKGVFGHRYDSFGNSVGGEFLVNTYTAGSERDPAIAFAVDGSFIVAWGAGERGIVGQRFNSLGGRIGSEFIAPDLFSPANLAGSPPGLDVDDDGSFVVAGSNYDGSLYGGVFAQVFNGTGASVGGIFQVNTFTYATQRNPHVAFGQDSDFVVVWEGSGQDSYNYGIFAQRFSSSGARSGTEFQVATHTDSNEREPAIAAGAGTDGFVVVWQGRGGYSYQGILGQRLP